MFQYPLIPRFIAITLLLILSTHAVQAARGTLLLRQNFPGKPVEQLTVAPDNAEVLYGAIDLVGGGQAIVRSEDGGLSWAAGTPIVGDNEVITCIEISPFDHDVLFAAFQHGETFGLARSENGGLDWQEARFTDQEGRLSWPIKPIAASPADPNILYLAAGSFGVYKSKNGGLEWFPASTGLQLDPGNTPFLAVSPSQPQTLYLLFDALDNDKGLQLYRSDNGGLSWQRKTTLDSDSYEFHLALSPTQPNRLYALEYSVIAPNMSGSQLYISTDGGASWQAKGEPVEGQPWAIKPWSDGTTEGVLAAALYPGGLWLSTNEEASWQSLVPEYHGQTILDLAYSPTEPNTLYLSLENSIVRSTDLGQNWEVLPEPDLPQRYRGNLRHGAQIVLDGADTTRAYASTDSGLYGSQDGGISWQRIDSGFPVRRELFAAPDQAELLFANADRRIERSDDGGKSWHALPAPADIRLVAVAEHGDTLYGLSGLSMLWRSLDGGQSWRSFDSQDSGVSAIRKIIVDPNHSALLYAIPINYEDYHGGFIPPPNGSLRRSADGGETWIDLGYVAEKSPPQQVLAVAQHDNTLLYQLVNNAVYRSDDAGLTWLQQPSPGLMQSIAVNPEQPEMLYGAGSHWNYPLPGTTTGFSTYKIYTSTDGGNTWKTLLETEFPGQTIHIEELLFSPFIHGLLESNSFFSSPLVMDDYPLVWYDPDNAGLSLTLYPYDSRIWGLLTYYDLAGQPRWLAFADKVPPDSGLIDTPLWEYHGPETPFDFGLQRLVYQAVGQLQLDFSDPFTPQASYSYDGHANTLQLSAFRPLANAWLSGVWWDIEQPGQGLILSQQGTDVWGYWYFYDANGQSIWLLFSGGWNNDHMDSDLYAFTGPTTIVPADQSRELNAQQIGHMTLSLSEQDQLHFSYSLNDGQSGVMDVHPPF